ncbi:helicase [Rhodoplanes elegans]|uniref:Helicase n=1 Tax=Rhodoplanes elegans TaxID=29408 RepID=A0A327KT07_9BRAD|nr:toprim domain-containing protein [Rhodoplanes elegans]MBK5958094.1 helicase [Rhodoplanes elegans]MBK5958186.1 helicase [Rhodoplanes elegans]RAI41969.1 helicase [Rhodoplanes elegans]
MAFHEKTALAATGKWRGILLSFGVPERALSGKHGPCPICGGTDRFRYDDKDRRGTWICGQCGAGDGMKLAIEFTGKPFSEVAARIDEMLGNLKPDSTLPKVDLTDEQRIKALRAIWVETRPVTPGDLVHRYFDARGIEERVVYPRALRFGERLRDGDGGVRPALVAMVGLFGVPKFVSMHRTFLRPDGLAKAEMPSPRKLMPGSLPDGACVMLSDYTHGPLGIAEGIETALSASILYEMPVWAAINSALMAKWHPPPACDEVAIFGDNDPKYGGQYAAYSLAHRLAVKNIEVSVHIPPIVGQDWNDVLMASRGLSGGA